MGVKFSDICFVTRDVPRLRAFYESVFGAAAEGDEYHSYIALDGLYVTFDFVDSVREQSSFGYVEAGTANNALLCFDATDVDAEYERLRLMNADIINEPTTHPWGARSFQFRDPDGNILNFRSIP